jgi:hypothetical protein
MDAVNLRKTELVPFSCFERVLRTYSTLGSALRIGTVPGREKLNPISYVKIRNMIPVDSVDQ